MQEKLQREAGQRINLLLSKAEYDQGVRTASTNSEHVELVAAALLDPPRATAAHAYRCDLRRAAQDALRRRQSGSPFSPLVARTFAQDSQKVQGD